MSIVFAEDFETNDFSNWPQTVSTGTSLNITTGAALEGTYGLEFDVVPSSSDELRNEVLSIGGTTQRFGFRLDLNDLSLATSAMIDELFRMNNAGGDVQLIIRLVEDTGIKVRVIAYDGAFNPYTVTSAAQSGEITVEVKVTDTVVELFINGSSVGTDTAASGLSLSSVEVLILNGAGGGGSNTGTFFVDDIQFENTDTELFPPGENSFRFLGWAADGTHLIVSGLKDGATLTAYRFDLDDLTESGTATFGAATNTEIDNGTRGLKPVWSYGNDGKWLMYGRDGNNRQVQYNTTAGTGVWTDTGAGTATWATTKVAIALMPWVLDSTDLIIAFSDDDIYRSIDDGATWVKQGDAGGTLRYGRRDAIHGERLMFGGTATGTVLYSHNWGQSCDDRSGTVLDGIAQAIAVSYDLP